MAAVGRPDGMQPIDVLERELDALSAQLREWFTAVNSLHNPGQLDHMQNLASSLKPLSLPGSQFCSTLYDLSLERERALSTRVLQPLQRLIAELREMRAKVSESAAPPNGARQPAAPSNEELRARLAEVRARTQQRAAEIQAAFVEVWRAYFRGGHELCATLAFVPAGPVAATRTSPLPLSAASSAASPLPSLSSSPLRPPSPMMASSSSSSSSSAPAHPSASSLQTQSPSLPQSQASTSAGEAGALVSPRSAGTGGTVRVALGRRRMETLTEAPQATALASATLSSSPPQRPVRPTVSVAGGWVAPTTPSALAGSLNSLLQAAESAAPATSSLLQLQQADATEALRGPASSAASEATPASVSSSPSTAFSSVLSSSRGRGAPGWTFPDRKASESLSSMPPVGAAASNPLSSSAGAAGATGVSLSGIQAALQAASGRVFEVQKISSGTIRTGKPATLQVDAGQGALVRYNPKKQTRKVFPAETLLKLQRSAANMRKLKVFWRRKDGPARYIFQTAEERERFVEAAAWLRTATALAAVPSTPQPSAQPQSQAQASVSASALLVQGAVQQEEIKVLCGTWNMGNAPPPSDPALWEAWLSREARYDLVAVAVQECEYAPGPGASNCEEDFFERVHRHLGEQYVRIGAQSLLAIRLLVLARREHAHKITRVRKGKEATGIGNVYGNKGAVAISLQFNETSICFVGSHLAARDERIRERNQNYMDIVARLHLAPAPFDILTYHEHVFWLGDLNYRVQIPRERAIELLQQGTPRALEELLERDQLREQLACGNAFAGFSEGPLSFLPTYRYVRGPPGQALAYSDEKMRTPSWCDRILYRSHPNRSLTLVAYRSVPEFGTSDHKPVLAAFRLRTLLTNLPHPQQPCRLQFSGLALELDPSAARHHHGAPPDPYVSFHARFLEQPLSSEPLRRCFAGQWRDDQLPCLEPFVTNREFLEMQSLLVHVRDQRQVLGSGVLSLQGALSHRGVAFEVALYLHGRRAGLLRGRLQGIYEEERQASPGVISLTPQTLAGGKQGYLLKQGGRRKNWKRRWVELLPPNTVRYSASRDALQILGSFSLLASDVGEMPAAAVDKQNCFYCRTPKRLWLFCADTYGEMREWLEAFRHAIATASSHPT